PFMLRYAVPDDFGEPKTAFNFCTFWLIEALHLAGRSEEARQMFEEMLSRRTKAGLLSEDITFDGKELWGNYPQTYSLVGLINCVVTSAAGILLKPVRLRPIAMIAAAVLVILDLATTRTSGQGVMIVRGLAGLPEGVLLWISIGFISRTATPERWAAVLFTG